VYMLQLSLIFSIYRSAVLSNGIYILLGLGLVGFLAVEVIMVSCVLFGLLTLLPGFFVSRNILYVAVLYVFNVFVITLVFLLACILTCIYLSGWFSKIHSGSVMQA